MESLRGVRSRLSVDARFPMLLFGAAVAGAVALLVAYHSDLTFWRDEWDFVLHRSEISADNLLSPHLEHVAVLHLALYNILLRVFGLDSPLPFQLVAIGVFALSVVLVWLFVRRRVGAWLALAGVLPLLVLGSASDDLLWPFQVAFFGSMSFGVGALLALERGDRRGDVLACALLIGSLFFSSLGLAFAGGVFVHVALGSDRWRRWWVVAVPAALFALWWLGWGREAENMVSLHNLATAPSYVLDGFASSLSSLLGLGAPRDEMQVTSLDWGRPLLVVAATGAAWWLLGTRRLPRWLLVVLAIGVGFWTLAALNATLFREPTSGRYQYMGAIFILLIAAELARGVRFSRWVVAPVLAVFCAAAVSNLEELDNEAKLLGKIGELQKAGLAVLEMTREEVDPGFVLDSPNLGVDNLGWIDAGSYFAAIDRFGSPAFSPEEVAAASEDARAGADRTFAAALELELAPGRRGRSAGTCEHVGAPDDAPGVVLPAGGATLVGGDERAEVTLRRYATAAFPVELGAVDAGTTRVLEIPGDRSAEPWELSASAPLQVCAEAPN